MVIKDYKCETTVDEKANMILLHVEGLMSVQNEDFLPFKQKFEIPLQVGVSNSLKCKSFSRD